MNKLFEVRLESEAEVGYVLYRKFPLLRGIGILLLLWFIPFLMIMTMGPIVLAFCAVVGTVFVIRLFLKLWEGEWRKKVECLNDEITIFDEDLLNGRLGFHLKDFQDLEIISEPSGDSIGTRPIPFAYLKLTLSRRTQIDFASSGYDGQLKQIRNFVINRSNEFRKKNASELNNPIN